MITKTLKYIKLSDSSLEIFLKKETLFNSEGNPYIEAIIDGKDRVLEKNVFFYDTLGRKVKLNNMICLGIMSLTMFNYQLKLVYMNIKNN